MKIDSNKLVELVGVLAVVLSVLFLAYEVNQSNKIAIATMEYEIRNNLTTLNELGMTDTAWAELSVNMGNPDYKMTAVERFKAGHFMSRMVNIWQATAEAYDRGLVSETTYNLLVKNDIRWFVFSRPAIHDSLYKFIDAYPSAKNLETIRTLKQNLEEYKSLSVVED